MVRGEIYRYRVPRDTRGRVQRGPRFAVIVQADELLALSTVLICPTSPSAAPRSFRPPIMVEGRATRVLVEQTTVVTLDRLGDAAGRLNTFELRSLDNALALVLGLA